VAGLDDLGTVILLFRALIARVAFSAQLLDLDWRGQV